MTDIKIGLTWARGAQAWTPQRVVTSTAADTTLQPWSDIGASEEMYWTGPLPDIALAPGSRVQLFVFRGGDAGNGCTIHDIAVTLTRETEASIVQAGPVGPYMLVPGPQS